LRKIDFFQHVFRIKQSLRTMDSKTTKPETLENKPTPPTQTLCQVCGDDNSTSSHTICAEMAPVIARRRAQQETRVLNEGRAKRERRD
jgi:hypothetical protein